MQTTHKKILHKEILRRRTFGIISHPDAGKTTLTEKLLLFGGAIQMAGSVKGRKASRHATSDWMAIERERGISVTSSVMQFDFGDCEINLLDTPGHQDFLKGNQTPVFFGSAINNFGVRELLDTFVEIAPSPLPRPTTTRMVFPEEETFSGFVFKIQANMDPSHRDRIAFLRVCSGRLSWGRWVCCSSK